jgi:hypothetical protein
MGKKNACIYVFEAQKHEVTLNLVTLPLTTWVCHDNEGLDVTGKVKCAMVIN